MPRGPFHTWRKIYENASVCFVQKCPAANAHCIFKVDFSETYLMISAENSISEPPNLKIFYWRIPPDPPTRLVLSALPCPPGGKKPSYGPGNLFIFFEFVQSVPSFVFAVLFTPTSNVLNRYSYPSLNLVAALTVWILPDKFRATTAPYESG